jgi:hypothetical protein
MPKKKHIKTIFGLFWTISPTRMNLMIWLGTYFEALTLGHTSLPLAGLYVPFWVHLGLPKCPRTAKKILFPGCFGLFLLQEWTK